MNKADDDFNLQDQNMTTEVASITTREIQAIDVPSTDLFMKVDVPEAYRIDAKPFIERPFYVDQVSFPASAPRYSLLNNSVRFIPGDIARSNESLLNMFKMGAYGRPDLVLNISMAGTITHAGCVLVGVLPPLPAFPQGALNLVNTIMAGPHAFLNANEATSIALPVPWYCNTDMATLDMQISNYDPTLDITSINGNYATIVYMVLNPLRPSTGSSTSLNIIVEACFKHFDIVVPTPRFVSWQTQSKSKSSDKAMAMKNPIFHDLEAVTTHIVELAEEVNKSRSNTLKLIGALGSLASIIGVALRVASACVEDPSGFEPQSGLFSTLTSGITGLLDHTASGLKTVSSDAIDSVRSKLRDWTGLHNPNDPAIHSRVLNTHINYSNAVDVPQMFEKLDPYSTFNRVAKEPIFGTAVDEMQISHIVSKDYLIGSFAVTVNDAVGALKWARPISPFQGGITNDSDGIICANNMELLHSLHRAWRGGLKIKIQSVMNNKQQVKLKVLKYYNPSRRITSSYPSYTSIANAPSHLLEFTQGGQMHEISLPYLCRNDLCPCAENTSVEALFHGMYYIYVAQPLANSDGSPNTIEFNIYMTGDSDLQFYGYTKANSYHAKFGILPTPTSREAKPETVVDTKDTVEVGIETPIPLRAFFDYVTAPGYTIDQWVDEQLIIQKWINRFNKKLSREELYNAAVKQHGTAVAFKVKGELAKYKPQSGYAPQSGKVEVMNKPQRQHYNARQEQSNEEFSHYTRLAPNVDIRPLIRRMYKASGDTKTIERRSNENIAIPLSSFIGEDPSRWQYTPIESLSRMYYGKNVGFKVRFVLTLGPLEIDQSKIVLDLADITARVYYLPQNVSYILSNNTITLASPNTTAFPAPGPSSPLGEIPLTYQLTPRYENSNSMVYEFVIPDTSFYKFMGSPNKFFDFDSNANPPQLSTADFGTIVLQLHNNNGNYAIPVYLETFVGLTDETRFGFQCISPPFVLYKTSSYYLGDGDSQSATIPNTKNNFIYRGGFL